MVHLAATQAWLELVQSCSTRTMGQRWHAFANVLSVQPTTRQRLLPCCWALRYSCYLQRLGTHIVIILQAAHALGMQRIQVFGDSELVVRQAQGKYKIKNQVLCKIHQRVQELRGHFEVCVQCMARCSTLRRIQEFTIEHVRREDNAEADELSNEAIDDPSLQGLQGADGVLYDLAACDDVVALVDRAQSD